MRHDPNAHEVDNETASYGGLRMDTNEPAMNDTLCEELLYDREQDLKQAEARLSALQPILDKAIKLTVLEFAIVESMVEAANYPATDAARLKQVATVLDELFTAVKKWQQANATA